MKLVERPSARVVGNRRCLFINAAPPASSAVQGAINSIVDVNYTIGSLNLLSLSPNFQGIQIPAGQSLTVVEAKSNTIGTYVSSDLLFVGSGVESGSTAQAFATVTGEGTLVVSNIAANVVVTQTSGLDGSKMATLDLSGLRTVSNLRGYTVA